MGMPWDLAWLSVPAYVALQAYLLFRGGRRASAAVWAPVFLMAAVFSYSAYNLAVGGNLWPLPLLFAAPVACLYLLAVWASSPDAAPASPPID
jgi:hypothetical protein